MPDLVWGIPLTLASCYFVFFTAHACYKDIRKVFDDIEQGTQKAAPGIWSSRDDDFDDVGDGGADFPFSVDEPVSAAEQPGAKPTADDPPEQVVTTAHGQVTIEVDIEQHAEQKHTVNDTPEHAQESEPRPVQDPDNGLRVSGVLRQNRWAR